MNVLLVDNTPSQRMTLEHRLNAMGIKQVTHANGALNALERIKNSSSKFDLVIADLLMEPMDGIGLMRELANQAATYRPPLAVFGTLDKTVERAIHSLAKALDYPLAGFIGNPLHNTGLAHIFENLATRQPSIRRAKPCAEPKCSEFSLAEILEGLAQDQFEPHFQPKVSARTLNLAGVEALARWNHPECGLVTPEAFIPVLEKSGDIHRLTDIIADKTIKSLALFSQHGIDTSASINLSLSQLDHYDAVERLRQLASKYGVANRRITVEITESARIRNLAVTLEALSRLRLHGFGLSLDHFGAGYSSIRNLDILPASELKIDPSYIADINLNSIHRKLVKSFVDLGRHIGATVVAEGIETERQCQYLTQIGCAVLQGYHIDKAMSAEQLILSYGCIAA